MKYRVLVTRNTTESAEIIVDAPSVQEAEKKAVLVAKLAPAQFRWYDDENVKHEYYVGDPGNSAEEIE